MSMSLFYYCLCGFFCCCRCFNPSLCHLSPFLLSYVAVSRSCQCQYFTIVFVLFSVAVTVLTHLCVICRHFCCPMLLFQGHVVCWNFTPTCASLKMKKWSSQCTQLCNCGKKPEKKKSAFHLQFWQSGKEILTMVMTSLFPHTCVNQTKLFETKLKWNTIYFSSTYLIARLGFMALLKQHPWANRPE